MATSMLRWYVTQGCRSLSRVRRQFSSGSSNEVNSLPLSQRPSFLPTPQYATVSQDSHDTQVTTLENGLRVASVNKFGQFCTIGVVIDSGSRYEVNYPSGVSHFLEKIAFTSTSDYESRDEIQQDLENIGGIVDCQCSRDTMIYAMSAETSGLAKAMHILSQAVNRPEISDELLDITRQSIGFELESHRMNPSPDVLLTEMIFAAAYRDNTLGLPKLCPEENIPVIDRRTLYTYLHSFHDPSRMVLAGVGMDHDQLVQLARQYFLEMRPVWTEDRIILDKSKGRDDSIAQYTGGLALEEADLSNVSLGPTAMPHLAHLVIGLESCSVTDDDFVAFCVLNTLMGGGGSFSAGGPGKGMYTRLYLNVLNQYHWIHSATAYNHVFADSGLFCIHASSHPDQLKSLTEVITREISNTGTQIMNEELSRAKRQVQSMMMMSLEQRPVVFEDVGRQVLSSGHRKPPEHYFNLIGKITEDDIRRVSERMLRSKPAVAAYGNLKHLPTLDNIQSLLLNKGKPNRRFSLFSR